MNKFVNVDNLTEVSFYEAMELFASGALIESHIEDADGIITEWNKYSLFEGLERAVTFNEIFNAKWYLHNDSFLVSQYNEEFDEGDM